LASATPDLDGLQGWLQQLTVNGTTFTDERGREVRLAPSTFSQGEGKLVVLDEHGNFLAALPALDGVAPLAPFDTARIPLLDRVLPVALTGETTPERLYATSPDGKFTMAAPVLAEDGALLGMLVLTAQFPPEFQSLYLLLVPLVGGSLILFALAAGAVGTVFGWITARGLSRRLGHLERASHAWSQGDFSARVSDTSGDELGQLARRLNQMAGELDTLLQTRRALVSVEERNRLARELHASVKQQVFGAAMQISTAQTLIERDAAAARIHLAEADRLTRLVQQELTSLIRELRPAALEGKGLAQALREYVVQWSRHTSIAADMRVQGERALPLAVEQELFRVAQEALANVARHSQAAAANVYLFYENDSVMLTISDNGRGFHPASAYGKGVGLISMRERTEAVGGSLQITSQPGEGARIIARYAARQN
jgi:NarL family two-component system sensor histidine kinase LiaS